MHTKNYEILSSLFEQKIAILVGGFQIFNCCGKAVSRSHKDQKWFPSENDKENKKKTTKNLTRVAAGKTAILCRGGRKTGSFCAEPAESK